MKEKLTHFRIGQIVNTQGLKGEVRVYPYVDDINRFDELENFYLDKNFNQEFEVERVRSRENSVDLDEDEFFIADLIGLDVFTVAGEKVGTLKDVLQYSANDVYVVKGDNDKEYLIPSTLKFVPEINIEEKKMIIDPIKGMLD